MATRKRGRDASGHVDLFHQRRKRFEPFLRAMGLAEHFDPLPRSGREMYWQYKNHDPELEFDATVPDDPAHRSLRRAAEEGFGKAMMVVDRRPITVRDFFSILPGMARVARDIKDQPGVPKPVAIFSHAMAKLSEEWFEPNIPNAWVALHQAVVCPLVGNSRLDTRLMTATFKQEFTDSGKFVIRMIVSATPPQVAQVKLDGARRPAYRVGTCNEWDRVRWASWDGDVLDDGDPARHVPACGVPVYAQAHALRNLRERINLPSAAPYLEHWLHQSLNEPVVVERQGKDLLVEFRIMEDRIGYLVVTPTDDAGAVVVRTFKFLTMEGTPEARLLKQRMKLTRLDVDWLRLSELSSFTQTDLRDDAQLRALLEGCGCGHLFELHKWSGDAFAPQAKPFAAEVRKYLRMAA